MDFGLRRWVACLVLCSLLGLSGCKKEAPVEQHAVSSAPASVPVPSTQTTSASPPPASAQPSRPSGPIVFTDVTAQAGIHFKHNSGAFGKKYLPETMGSGACFLDYDNDGWQDILLINSMDWPGHRTGNSYLALYHNNQNGTFTDVTKQAGLSLVNY